MGWLFGRRRDAEDANEILRRYNEAEAARLELAGLVLAEKIPVDRGDVVRLAASV